MSTKAERLGAGASFGSAQGISARRAAIQSVTKAPTEGAPSPSSVHESKIAHNPFNVRDELSGVEETAESLRVKGQLQPLAVVTVEAFMNIYPDALIDEAAMYVAIDGNRRLAAARIAGLEYLQIHINDLLAQSTENVLESALIANIHRVDVPPMDQARAIQQLLDAHGTQAKVAQRLGKTEAWVSQRIALLGLDEELQEKVDAGELKVKDGRRIGRLPAERQKQEAHQALNRVKTPRKSRREEPAPAPTPEPVITEASAPPAAEVPAQAVGESATGLNPVKTESAPEAEAGQSPDGLRWDDPSWFDRELRKYMSAENRAKLVWLLQAEE